MHITGTVNVYDIQLSGRHRKWRVEGGNPPSVYAPDASMLLGVA